MRSLLVVSTLLTVASAAGCAAKIVVVPVPVRLSSDTTRMEGMFYALPRTVARVAMKAEMKRATDAPYSAFAVIFAPGDEPACDSTCAPGDNGKPASKTTYSLKQGAVFSTFGEPDSGNIYLVKFAGSRAMDQSLNMTWTESGVLTAASAEVTNRTGDDVLAALKLVAGVGTNLFRGASRLDFAPSAPSPGAKRPVDSCPPPYERTRRDPAMVRVLRAAAPSEKREQVVRTYCGLTREVRKSLSTDTTKLLRAAVAYRDQVAPLAAMRLDALESRQVSDPVPLVAKLDALISERLRALYLGTTETKTWDFSMDVRDLAVKTSTLLRMDGKKGLCLDSAQLSPGTNEPPGGFKIHDPDACSLGTPVQLTVAYYPDSSAQLFGKARSLVGPSMGEGGFRYRIPAQVRAELRDKTKSYGDAVFSVAQLGTVGTLPARRNAKQISYDIALVESTGGLKSFKLGSAGGLDAGMIDALAGVGGTVVDFRNSKKKEREEKEVDALTREQTILELKDQICELEKKYGRECTAHP